MHNRVTRLFDNTDNRQAPLPVVELPTGPAGEARVWFREEGESQVVLVGYRPALPGHPVPSGG
jgi:hypothetical protein